MRVVLVGLLGILAVGCNGGPGAPSAAPAGPVHVYVTWTASGAFLDRVPDEVALGALAKLEAAAGGTLVIHRQQVGSPQVRIRIDDSILDRGNRGEALPTGPCAGEIALESSAVVDDYILVHELGHLFVALEHSPYCGDILVAGGTLCPTRPTTFSAREASILRANVAAGCVRIESWAEVR